MDSIITVSYGILRIQYLYLKFNFNFLIDFIKNDSHYLLKFPISFMSHHLLPFQMLLLCITLFFLKSFIFMIVFAIIF